MDVKVAELKAVWSRLKLREDEPIKMYDAQAMVATEMEQLRTQLANKTSEFVEIKSAVKESERHAKRAKVV